MTLLRPLSAARLSRRDKALGQLFPPLRAAPEARNEERGRGRTAEPRRGGPAGPGVALPGPEQRAPLRRPPHTQPLPGRAPRRALPAGSSFPAPRRLPSRLPARLTSAPLQKRTANFGLLPPSTPSPSPPATHPPPLFNSLLLSLSLKSFTSFGCSWSFPPTPPLPNRFLPFPNFASRFRLGLVPNSNLRVIISLCDKCCGFPCLRRDIALAFTLASPGELHWFGGMCWGADPPPLFFPLYSSSSLSSSSFKKIKNEKKSLLFVAAVVHWMGFPLN